MISVFPLSGTIERTMVRPYFWNSALSDGFQHFSFAAVSLLGCVCGLTDSALESRLDLCACRMGVQRVLGLLYG